MATGTDRYSARPHEQLTFDCRKIPLPAGDRTISTCANTVCSPVRTRFRKAGLKDRIARESATCGDVAKSSRFHSSTMIQDGDFKPMRGASISGISSAVRVACGGSVVIWTRATTGPRLSI
jgi:hypothetical protein